jgi:hypothetical protein
LEFLLEERSAEEALSILLPRLLDPETSWELHAFQGKTDLLRKLAIRLRGYARWVATSNTRIAVLIDEDRQDCHGLKRQLENAAAAAGLLTKTNARGGTFTVLNRIAVEELEAWFFGDCRALRAAYPRVPQHLEQKAFCRHPDAITGGTWERLEKVLQAAGYHRAGLSKTIAAREIAEHMDTTLNTSPSFRCFCSGIQALQKA